MAVGDALGAPLEGLSAQQIRVHYGLVVDYVDGALAWKKKPYRWRLPGLYSDDTQQALALAEVLLAHGRMDLGRLAELYLGLARPIPKDSFAGAHRGIARSFRKVLDELERGAAPAEAGQDSAGVGAAVRIAPVALYFSGQPEAMAEATVAASRMTHRDIRSIAGALAVAHAVRLLAAGAEPAPSFLFKLAAEVARAEDKLADDFGAGLSSIAEHRHSLSCSIAHAESVLDRPRDLALSALVDEANRHGAEPACKRPTMGFPPACIPTCLYLLLTTESLEEALVEVVNLGGDADSAGAILGALAGARHGVDAIPPRWLDGLRNLDGIELRARALARRDANGLAIPDFFETERELTQLESESRTLLLNQRQGGGDHLKKC
jgi:ADP-ribosylglycohydrolase